MHSACCKIRGGKTPTTEPKASFHQQGREVGRGGGLGLGLFADLTNPGSRKEG